MFKKTKLKTSYNNRNATEDLLRPTLSRQDEYSNFNVRITIRNTQDKLTDRFTEDIRIITGTLEQETKCLILPSTY
jgi:hypothetical protein